MKRTKEGTFKELLSRAMQCIFFNDTRDATKIGITPNYPWLLESTCKNPAEMEPGGCPGFISSTYKCVHIDGEISIKLPAARFKDLARDRMMEHGTVYSHSRGSLLDVSHILGDRGMHGSQHLQLLLEACVQGMGNIYESCWIPLVFGQIMHSM